MTGNRLPATKIITTNGYPGPLLNGCTPAHNMRIVLM